VEVYCDNMIDGGYQLMDCGYEPDVDNQWYNCVDGERNSAKKDNIGNLVRSRE
jgi:hypothetical protein